MANAVCRKLLVMFRLLGGDDGIFARPDESLSVTDRVLGVRGRLLVERKVSRTQLDRRAAVQPVGDLGVGEIFEKLLDRAYARFIDVDVPLAVMFGGPGVWFVLPCHTPTIFCLSLP